MTLQVKKTGGSLLPWVVEDDTGSVAWCGSWEDAISTANEYAREVEVQLLRPDKLFIEHCYSWDVGYYDRDIAQFGDVEASRSMAACGSPRVRLGDIVFASVDEARRTAAQLLSACQWAQRPAVKGKVS
ncbi:hypothetical protein [Corynebacterium amycolatum]|uniref:hypothetical protein n=1 Tax=Corynebacterium amycolatum TaxID=43765 RepID=UPI00345A7DD7